MRRATKAVAEARTSPHCARHTVGMGTRSHWLSKPLLVGDMVTLRPVEAGDVDAMWEMVNDPVGNDLTDTTETFTYDQIARWCDSRQSQDERLDLAIVENTSGRYAGEVVLNEFDAETNGANFRIALRGPDWYGRGLGTEATRLIVRHGFDVIGLERVTLSVLARNPRARSTYKTAGFRPTGETVEGAETWIHMAIARQRD